MLAIYFDGQRSASTQVSVVWNEVSNELCIELPNAEKVYWSLANLSIQAYGDTAEISCSRQPNALLKIELAYLPNRLYKSIQQQEPLDPHKSLVRLGLVKILAIAIGLIGLVVTAYIFLLPIVTDKLVSLMPESFDNQIGDTVMESFLQENKVDSVKTRYLTAFAANLNLDNKKPLRFSVVKSDEVNAFALPNGQIVVYDAILKKLDSPDQLAALLGHEASHINQRHSVKMLSRSLVGYLIVSLMLSDVNGIMTVIADNAHQLNSLSYSRKFEQEADEKGLQIMMNNRMNPKGMVRLFEELEKEEKISMPALLSSHPLTAQRKENMEKIIKKSRFQVSESNQLSQLFRKLKR